MDYVHPIFPSDDLSLNVSSIRELFLKILETYPDRTFAVRMDAEQDQLPLETVTWGQVLTDAKSIAEELGRVSRGHGSLTVGILCSSGYHLLVHVFAVWLNGWTVLLLSPRNSVSALDSLLSSVDASVLLVDQSTAEVGQDLSRRIPSLSIYNTATAGRGPANSQQTENYYTPKLDDILIYTHTSGSTGHPKPVPTIHRHFLQQIRLRTANQYAGHLVYAPVPLYHGMGFYAFTRWPICSGIVPVLVESKKPITAEVVLRHLRILPKTLLWTVPSILEDISLKPSEDINILATTHRICFGGAPMRADAARKLLAHDVPLVSAYASTELGIMTTLDFPSVDWKEDWEYVIFRDDHYVLHFQRQEGSNLHELIVSPDSEDSPSVLNCVDPVGFSARDLWSPHPSKPGLWKHMGRKDSVTVLSTGEKTDNVQIENLLREDERITAVVVFGTGKAFNGVILGIAQPTVTLDDLWPSIERVNAIIPHHSRLLRQMVILADLSRPIVRTDKGTIRPKATTDLYDEDISEAYRQMELGGNRPAQSQGTNGMSQEAMDAIVRETVQRVLSRRIMDSEDMFDQGLDSLGAVRIRAELLSGLPDIPPRSIPRNLVYEYSTISSLRSYFVNLQKGVQDCEYIQHLGDVSQFRSCLERFMEQVNENAPKISGAPKSSDGYVVALTGATGSLGSHLLDNLLERSNVKHVYCLHRGVQPGLDRQLDAFSRWGIPHSKLLDNSGRVTFLQVELSQPTLGLSLEQLTELSSCLTHIIHAAWNLNFNWRLDHFERTHLPGVRHLLNLARCSHALQRFVFLSSIGVVTGYNPSEAVAEGPVADEAGTPLSGYGRAKLVAEKMIAKSGVPATIIRAGQLSGSTRNGYWTPTEYMPTLLRTSRRLRCIPHDLLPVRWLPVDTAAQSVLDLTVHEESSKLSYYHVENPVPTSWQKVIDMLSSAMRQEFTRVPMAEWLSRMEESGVADHSALGLAAFYADLTNSKKQGKGLRLDVTQAAKISPHLEYGKISQDLIQQYAKWW
ncbi:acetyl-CoA synthetase-like protein [Pluteus cervinus]|uniref:Acetyl-CoA synthetase-like protein n=1 Tax=Pluteus cervinus TaxID=181527 RepID=A0ACD3A702_9AGAR|nr:acetyl-CoA synthetase-like protein [Pluteus cervinus]